MASALYPLVVASAVHRDCPCSCTSKTSWRCKPRRRPTNIGHVRLQLAIMTSDDTHARTAALLEKNSHFGSDPSQIHLLKQEKACRADAAVFFPKPSESVYICAVSLRDLRNISPV